MGSVEVTEFHYKLRGVCQSSVVEASDGHLYVLKIAGPHTPNLLFNEALGCELLAHFGLPVAQWKPLKLEADFIESHPDMWFKTGRNGRRPRAGLHFGSRLVSSKRGAGAYQIIPSSWVPRLKNRINFLGALAIDVWANHCDRRQAIYTPSGEGFKATFIDNGHMFGGLTGTELTCPRLCMNPDFAIYRELQLRGSLERWRKRIMTIDMADIGSLTKKIPSEWCSGELVKLTMTSLQLRRQKLTSLFHEVESILSQHHSLDSREFVSSLDRHVTFTPDSESVNTSDEC